MSGAAAVNSFIGGAHISQINELESNIQFYNTVLHIPSDRIRHTSLLITEFLQRNQAEHSNAYASVLRYLHNRGVIDLQVVSAVMATMASQAEQLQSQYLAGVVSNAMAPPATNHALALPLPYNRDGTGVLQMIALLNQHVLQMNQQVLQMSHQVQLSQTLLGVPPPPIRQLLIPQIAPPPADYVAPDIPSQISIPEGGTAVSVASSMTPPLSPTTTTCRSSAQVPVGGGPVGGRHTNSWIRLTGVFLRGVRKPQHTDIHTALNDMGDEVPSGLLCPVGGRWMVYYTSRPYMPSWRAMDGVQHVTTREGQIIRPTSKHFYCSCLTKNNDGGKDNRSNRSKSKQFRLTQCPAGAVPGTLLSSSLCAGISSPDRWFAEYSEGGYHAAGPELPFWSPVGPNGQLTGEFTQHIRELVIDHPTIAPSELIDRLADEFSFHRNPDTKAILQKVRSHVEYVKRSVISKEADSNS
jgi:hypothetical protein